jgi:hypothetical protein
VVVLVVIIVSSGLYLLSPATTTVSIEKTTQTISSIPSVSSISQITSSTQNISRNTTSITNTTESDSYSTSVNGPFTVVTEVNHATGLSLRMSINTTDHLEGAFNGPPNGSSFPWNLVLNLSVSNALPRESNISAASDWKLKGLSGSDCAPAYPLKFGMYAGYFTLSNISSGVPLTLIGPENYCGLGLGYPAYYVFQPLSDITAPGPATFFSTNINGSVTATTTVENYSSGSFAPYLSFSYPVFIYYASTPFNPYCSSNSCWRSMELPTGTYTIVGADEWGDLVLTHFKVLFNPLKTCIDPTFCNYSRQLTTGNWSFQAVEDDFVLPVGDPFVLNSTLTYRVFGNMTQFFNPLTTWKIVSQNGTVVAQYDPPANSTTITVHLGQVFHQNQTIPTYGWQPGNYTAHIYPRVFGGANVSLPFYLTSTLSLHYALTNSTTMVLVSSTG